MKRKLRHPIRAIREPFGTAQGGGGQVTALVEQEPLGAVESPVLA
jgi:hypothetical protein